MGSQVKDFLQLTLAEAARLVRAKEVSPIELVEACLARIRAANDKLAAYISVYEEQALAVAKAAEAMLRAGHWLGPLHGIPISLKDNVAVRGLATTAGSKILRDWIPDEDATVTARLRQAGAIFVGKTNMHEFAWGGTSANPHYGAVRNPWDPERFPAGSSGGSGVALLWGNRHRHRGLDPPAFCDQRHRGNSPNLRTRQQRRNYPVGVEHGHCRPDDSHGRGLRHHVQRHRRT